MHYRSRILRYAIMLLNTRWLLLFEFYIKYLRVYIYTRFVTQNFILGDCVCVCVFVWGGREVVFKYNV